ncbi:Kelch repeat-containing protein [Kaarinaea lacus]
MSVLKIISIFTIVLLVGACDNGGGSGVRISGAWEEVTPLDIPRYDLGVVAMGDKLYVLGGYSGSNLPMVDEYDPATDTWTSKANMPSPRRKMATASVNGKIYLISGSDSQGSDLRFTFTTEEFDPLTNQWTSKQDMPIVALPRPSYFRVTAASVNQKIYVATYNDNRSDGQSGLYMYDPLTDTWDANLTPPPFMHYEQPSAASSNGKFYVYTHSSFQGSPGGKLMEYDPSNDIWIILPSPRVSVERATLASYDETLFLIGGVTQTGPYAEYKTYHDTVQAFDIASQTWVVLDSMHNPRHSLGAAEVGGAIYAVGGDLGESLPTSAVEKFNLE